MTPRSKIKAMLAALDDDSDDQSTSKPSTTRELGASTSHTPTLTARRPAPQKLPFESGAEDDEHEDEDESIVLPRGKIAARLQAQKHADSETEQDAYTRVKQRLEQERQAERAQKETSEEETRPAVEKEQSPARLDVSTFKPKLMLRKKAKIVADDSEEEAVSEQPQLGSTLSHQERSKTVHIDSLSGTPQKTQHSQRDSPTTVAGGLFLTPEAPQATVLNREATIGNGSDTDLPDAHANNRFMALVAKKRAERRAKEAEEEKRRDERHQRSSNIPTSDLSGSEDDDTATSRKLTQQSRPARKASKKAIEELNREQQRIQRNMQLAHEATTKKKISKESFLARFGFKKVGAKEQDIAKLDQPIASATCSSAPVSDAEGRLEHQTPPTSPALPDVDSPKGKQPAWTEIPPSADDLVAAPAELQEDLTSATIMFPEDMSRDKGKGKAIEEALPEPLSKPKGSVFKQRAIKIHPPKDSVHQNSYGPDSDDDLEVMPQGKKSKKLDALFEKIPARKAADPGQSLQKLRTLAHLTSPSKRVDKKKTSLSTAQLATTLQRRARQQAAKERLEKIKELEARGIIIQTAEERARDQAQVEDILEKARQEAEELKKKEKGERKDKGEDELDSSEDEDYVEGASSDEEALPEEEDEEEVEVELSGSEEEEEEDEENDIEKNGLFDNEASESENEETDKVIVDAEEAGDEASEDEELVVAKSDRRSRQQRVVDDDDEDEDNQSESLPKPATQTTQTAAPLTATAETPAQARNPFAIMAGSPNQVKNPFAASASKSNAPLGLTQAFAATMSDSMIEESQEQDSIEQLQNMPQPDFPVHDALTQIGSQTQTQTQTASQINDSFQVNLEFEQSQIQDSVQHNSVHEMATQMSEIPDPTQDAGVGAISPVKARKAPPLPLSTVDTVIIPPVQVQESPTAKKKGRLHSRKEARARKVAVFSDEEADSERSQSEKEDGFEISANAFDILKRGVKKPKPVELFNRKDSRAKDMVDEQAEESEDEYAGLGGADGDDSEGEPDASLQEMIDESYVDVDESKLAALYADKDRAADEAAVQKLFKDINNGGLRRKRGAEFELDDSDDEIEQRRARKRAEFARMRRALVEGDANIGKIAEDPKKKAFLRAIEDRDGDADMDNWLNEEDTHVGDESTQEVPESQIPASQTENHDPDSIAMPAPDINALKRKRPAETTKASRRPFRPTKPTSLADIRASISSITEDPRDLSVSGSMFSASESSADEDAPQSRDSAALLRRTSRPIVDRLAAKRADSLSSATEGSNQRLAFHNPSESGDAPGFKVPSLLRRATTSSLTSMSGQDANGISHYVEKTERAIGGDKDVLKKGGSKKSSVNFFVREELKKKVLDESKRRKEEGRRRIAGERKGLLGSVFGRGTWE